MEGFEGAAVGAVVSGLEAADEMEGFGFVGEFAEDFGVDVGWAEGEFLRLGKLQELNAGLVEESGFEAPIAAALPGGDGEVFDEIGLDVVGGLEADGVGAEEGVEGVVVFADRDDVAGVERCLWAFWEARALPAGVLGPRDLAALARLARICFSVAMGWLTPRGVWHAEGVGG